MPGRSHLLAEETPVPVNEAELRCKPPSAPHPRASARGGASARSGSSSARGASTARSATSAEAALDAALNQAPVGAVPAPARHSAEAVAARTQALHERADRCLQGNMQSRALLREVEQMLWTAERDNDYSYDDETALEAHAAAASRSAEGEGRIEQRLRRCDELQTSSSAVRRSVDVYGGAPSSAPPKPARARADSLRARAGKLDEASSTNDRLQQEIASVLNLSDAEIAAELALQAEEAEAASTAGPGSSSGARGGASKGAGAGASRPGLA